MEGEGQFDGMLLHIAQQHSEGIEQVSKICHYQMSVNVSTHARALMYKKHVEIT